MCIILICDKKLPSKSLLKKSAKVNPHGAGIAWVRDGFVYWKKGIDTNEIVRMIEKKEVSLPFIVHYRIASVGDICNELTHPFTISKNPSLELEGKTKKGVLFHNGTWSEWRDYMLKATIKLKCTLPDGKMSDSRAMAFLCYHYDNKFLNLLEYNKVAILTPKGIEKYGDFQRIEKVNCSNNYLNPIVWSCDDNPTQTNCLTKNDESFNAYDMDDKWIYLNGCHYTSDELLDIGYSFEQIEKIKDADINALDYNEPPEFIAYNKVSSKHIKSKSKKQNKLSKKQKKKLKRLMRKKDLTNKQYENLNALREIDQHTENANQFDMYDNFGYNRSGIY